MTDMTDLTASGKSQATENFPVASWLIAPPYRKAIHAFYRFARAADDIADHADLSADAKMALLENYDRSLEAQGDIDHALALRQVALEKGLPLVHAHDLLKAFMLDVSKQRYADWDELIDYCSKSAMPVGRFVLDVHGEDKATFSASDALCAALQVINHLQDCADDFSEIDRVYIPLSDLAAFGESPAALGAGKTGPGLRQVFDRLLNRTSELLKLSRALAPQVRDTRLRMEVSVIQAVAERLVLRLRANDPLTRRVKLSKMDYAICLTQGVLRGAFARWVA
jgi:squalene synthase HpnC